MKQLFPGCNKGYWNPLLLCIFFVIYPLGALPFILEKISWKHRYAYTLFSLFMGLCAILYAPSGDLYRHTKVYFLAQNWGWNEFIEISLLKMDFFLIYITYFCAKIGIQFEIVRFLFVFVSYECAFWIFRDVVKQNKILQENRYYYVLGFLLFFMSVIFFNITQGLRYGLGVYIIGVGLYKLFQKHERSGWIWIFVACLIHFSFWGLLIPLVLFRLKLVRLNKWVVMIITLLLILFSNELFQALISLLPLSDFIKQHLLHYITGYWAKDFYQDHSFFFRISRILSYWTIYPLSFFFLMSYRKTDNLYRNFLLFMILVLGISVPFGDIFPRFSYLLILLFLADMLLRFYPVLSKIRMLNLIFCFVLFSFLANIYSSKRQLEISCEYKLLYSSFPVLLLNTYSENWINRNISEDGDIIK